MTVEEGHGQFCSCIKHVTVPVRFGYESRVCGVQVISLFVDRHLWLVMRCSLTWCSCTIDGWMTTSTPDTTRDRLNNQGQLDGYLQLWHYRQKNCEKIFITDQ